MRFLTAIALCFFLSSSYRPVSAAVGFTEWEVRTPGGHVITQSEALKQKFGICLRKSPSKTGPIYSEQNGPAEVYVSELRWWQYFKGYVIGGTQHCGYFLFNETTEGVNFFSKRAMLEAEMERLYIDAPLGKRMLPSDGWTAVWGAQVSKGSAAEERQMKDRLRGYCASLKSYMAFSNPNEIDQDEFEIRCSPGNGGFM